VATLSLSIKNVPVDVVRRLRERAERNHRSLQGELLDVVEHAADEPPLLAARTVYQRAERRHLAKARKPSRAIRRRRDAR
jgi:antitoxin FitA